MSDQYTVTLNLLDESFNPDEARNYGLSIVLNEWFFSCCVLDFRRNKFLGLHRSVRKDVKSPDTVAGQTPSFKNFMQDIGAAVPWLSHPFKLVKIAYEGNKATLIPDQLFNPDEKENYFTFNFPQEKDELILCDHLLPLAAWHIYAVPEAVVAETKIVFPKAKMTHASSLLIESIWVNYKNRINAPHVFMHLRDKIFDLVIFDGRQLNYFNTFSFRNPEDVAYYLIFVLEQLNFNPEKIPLVLLGTVELGNEVSELLLRYVRHVETGLRNEAYSYSYVLNHLPPQSFFPLLNFFSCGL